MFDKTNLKAFAMAAVLVAGVGLGGCRVEKTEEGELPEVDVDAEAGKLPEYDVDAADVDVETEKREVEVPTGVDVDYPEDENEEKPPAQ